jgi:hypothetical protein
MIDDPVTRSLRTALENRPAPPSGLDLEAIRTRGRRRRYRARAVSAAVALAVVAGVGVPASTADVDWPWARSGDSPASGTVLTVSAAGPEEVVQEFLAAQSAGESGRGFDDYWVPGHGARVDVTNAELDATEISLAAAQPVPAPDGWATAVRVGVSWNSSVGPWAGSYVLVRGDAGRWWIESLDGGPATPAITVVAEPEEDREAWARTGAVALDGGCLVLDEALLVWPTGSVWDVTTQQVVLGDGTRVGVGDRVETWGQPLQDIAHVLGSTGAAAAARCGGVDVPAGPATAGGRPVLEVTR